MPRLSKNKRAFTLIELLIVITIIGILATFVVASFSSAQAKGRDVRRKADLDALKKALELAKSDSPYGVYYPGCTTPLVGGCNITANSDITSPITPTYIKTIPKDPKDGSGYFYIPQPAPNCSSTNTCTGFIITVLLENSSDSDITPSQKRCNSISTGPVYKVCNF